MTDKHSRRTFLTSAAATFALSGCHVATPTRAPAPEAPAAAVPKRKLGRTGQSVSMIGLGGYHIGKPSEADAIALMHAAIEHGITFFDNCWDYHAGESERRMGKAIADRRDRVFLMSKIDGRDRATAAKQIDQCLSRLQTDYVDLMQIHEVIRHTDDEAVFADEGAIAALVAARDAGKLRYIGFTGHKSPAIHLEMLAAADAHGFVFDAVQMPLNPMDPHYDSFERRVLPVLRDKGIGVLGMKSLAGGFLLDSGVVSAEECLRYALSLPTDVVITGMEDRTRLDQALQVATAFEPLSEQARANLLARTQPAGAQGQYERFKTSQLYDGTERNPHWLNSDDPSDRGA